MSTNPIRGINPLAAVVLNLLVERPMHPYEMQKLMRERSHSRIVRLKGGSVYDTIERLQRLGLAEAVETTREGRRPERTVYRITPAGRSLMREWVREALAVPVSEYPRFAAGLAFAGSVVVPDQVLPTELTPEAAEAGRRQVVALLEQRIRRLEADVAAGAARVELLHGHPNLPRIFVLEDEYGLAMRRAELDWVRHLVEDLTEGDAWPSYESLMASLRAAAGAMEGDEMA